MIHRSVVRDRPGHPIAAPCAIEGCQFMKGFRMTRHGLTAVGFTGTRKGMSPNQKEQLEMILYWFYSINAFHHGNEPHADKEAEDIFLHSDSDDTLPSKIRLHKPKSFTAQHLLQRNREMVDQIDVLIAAPLTDTEQQRSGTWATVRYARQKGIPIILLPRKKGSRP